MTTYRLGYARVSTLEQDPQLQLDALAAARALPIAIVNQGPTRGDPLATLKVNASLGPSLTSLLASSS